MNEGNDQPVDFPRDDRRRGERSDAVGIVALVGDVAYDVCDISGVGLRIKAGREGQLPAFGLREQFIFDIAVTRRRLTVIPAFGYAVRRSPTELAIRYFATNHRWERFLSALQRRWKTLPDSSLATATPTPTSK